MKEMNVHGESSSSVGHSMVWGKLWKLHIPNKVRIFAWRACHDILPTHVKLARRFITKDDTCLLCNKDSESALHAYGIVVWLKMCGQIVRDDCKKWWEVSLM